MWNGFTHDGDGSACTGEPPPQPLCLGTTLDRDLPLHPGHIGLHMKGQAGPGTCQGAQNQLIHPKEAASDAESQQMPIAF